MLIRRAAYTRGVEGSPKSDRDRFVRLIDQAATALDALSHRERFADEDDLIQEFLRPHGLDREATPIFVDAVERLGRPSRSSSAMGTKRS
jgi:hypothetical protein